MKKKNFVSMLLGTLGGILFAIGMCMTLLPEWDAFTPGIVLGSIGLVVILIMLVIRRRMEGKPAIELNAKGIGVSTLGILGTLALGFGLALTMVWDDFLIHGIILGIVGIICIICIIPLYKGLE